MNPEKTDPVELAALLSDPRTFLVGFFTTGVPGGVKGLEPVAFCTGASKMRR